jgi:hypothetical protein
MSDREPLGGHLSLPSHYYLYVEVSNTQEPTSETHIT